MTEQFISSRENKGFATMSDPEVTREEFVSRFIAEMVRLAPFQCFKNADGSDGEWVLDYAAGTAPSYWDDEDMRAEGPEECASADIGYWSE